MRVYNNDTRGFSAFFTLYNIIIRCSSYGRRVSGACVRACVRLRRVLSGTRTQQRQRRCQCWEWGEKKKKIKEICCSSRRFLQIADCSSSGCRATCCDCALLPLRPLTVITLYLLPTTGDRSICTNDQKEANRQSRSPRFVSVGKTHRDRANL